MLVYCPQNPDFLMFLCVVVSATVQALVIKNSEQVIHRMAAIRLQSLIFRV